MTASQEETFVVDERGEIYCVKGDERELVPQDPGNELFCRYLTWASRNPKEANPEYQQLGLPATYCHNAEAVIQVCRKRGIILATTMPPGKDEHDLACTHAHDDFMKRGRFMELHQAVAAPVSRRCGVRVVDSLFRELVEGLKNENGEVRRRSTWPVKRAFVYIDVSDFSKFPAIEQVLVINSIVALVKNSAWWAAYPTQETHAALEAQMCIGDGYIFVFRQADHATWFAAYLAHMVEVLTAHRHWQIPVSFHFRVGVHVGEVFTFWDPGRNGWNYIGDGINGGQRVLSAIGKETDDVVFVSGQVREDLLARASDHNSFVYSERMLESLHNRGRRADKHGGMWRVYEVNHTDLVGERFIDPTTWPSEA